MSIGRDASYNLIGALIPLLLALATVPAYIFLVGAERYGVLSIAFLFLGYFGLFDLGLGRATTYRLSALAEAEPQARADVLWTALALNLLMGVIGGGTLWFGASYFFRVGIAASDSLRAEMISAVPLLAMCLPVAIMTGVLTGALQARKRFAETNAISVLSTALFQLFPILVAWLNGPRLAPLIAAALAARGIAILILLMRSYAVLGKGCEVRFKRGEVRGLLTFGGWIVADGLLNPLVAMVDRMAIGAVLGGAAITTYTVPYQLAQRITILPNALMSAVFPRLATSTPDERRRYAESAGKMLLAVVTVPVLGGIFIMRPFFHIWLGFDLGDQAARVGVLILAGFWLNALAWNPFSWLQGTGRPDLVTKAHLIEVVPYLVVLYSGLTKLGLLGAAIALILRNLVDLLLLTVAAKQQNVLLASLPFAVMVALATIISATFSYDSFTFWVAAAAILPIAVGLSWLILPATAKSIARSQFTKLLAKKPGSRAAKGG